jgi:enamine deaminase RidA (YjgF/YER057c/UK114 family)
MSLIEDQLKAQHARTATGVAQLPFGAAVQLDIILQLKK